MKKAEREALKQLGIAQYNWDRFDCSMFRMDKAAREYEWALLEKARATVRNLILT